MRGQRHRAGPYATAVLRWEDPPPDDAWTHPDVDWPTVADQLRTRPGQWAQVIVEGKVWSSADAGTATRRAPMRPLGAFEAVARHGLLYMRTVPQFSPTSTEE